MTHQPTPDELARYLAGELSDDKQRRVARWLQANPEVRLALEGVSGSVHPDVEAAVLRLRAAMNSDSSSDERSDPRPGASGVAESRAARAHRAKVLRPTRPPRPLRGSVRHASASARRVTGAAIVLVALSAVVLWISGRNETPETYIAEAGARRTVELEDGTSVTLNAASRLIVHSGFGEEQREVTLEGEAHFAVERDSSRPFIVESGAATVTVLGTTFNVDGYAADRVTVVVGEGRVRMQQRAGPGVELGAGDRGRLVADAGSIVVDRGSIDEAIAWMDDRMVFRAIPMQDVAARLERQYGIEVEISADLAERRLDGTFASQPIEEVASLIASALGVEVSVESDHVRFSSREGGE